MRENTLTRYPSRTYISFDKQRIPISFVYRRSSPSDTFAIRIHISFLFSLSLFCAIVQTMLRSRGSRHAQNSHKQMHKIHSDAPTL